MKKTYKHPLATAYAVSTSQLLADSLSVSEGSTDMQDAKAFQTLDFEEFEE